MNVSLIDRPEPAGQPHSLVCEVEKLRRGNWMNRMRRHIVRRAARLSTALFVLAVVMNCSAAARGDGMPSPYFGEPILSPDSGPVKAGPKKVPGGAPTLRVGGTAPSSAD